MIAAKKTPWWQPTFRTPDGRTRTDMDRDDAARLLRDKRRSGDMYRSKDTHGRRVHTLTAERFISGYIVI